jgi:Spy/CpxP family protein refolding chaperone
MRRILMASALLVAMVALSQSQAQFDPEMAKVFRAVGRVMFDNPAALVNNPGVQKELKMDEDQVKAAREKVVMAGGFGGGFGGFGGKGGKGKELTDEQKEKMTKYMEKVQGLKDVPEDQLDAKIRETFKDEIEGPMKEVEKILKPEQMSRLKQISRQQGGPGAYLKPDNVTDLKLTDEQKTKLKAINDELQKDTGELRRGAGGGKGGFGQVSPETREKITALTKEANEKAAEVLTAEQKSKWKEVTGEPFTVTFEFRRPKKQDD